MDEIKLMLLVIAAQLHQHSWGRCISEENGDTAVNILCTNDDIGLETELSFLQYRSYTLNRINIFLDGVNNHPIITEGVLKKLFTPVVTLNVINTRILDFNEALVLANITELSIHDSSCTKIKFDDIQILKQATKLNVSQNSISVLKSAKQGKEQKLMETIDLSHNLISSVPENCFAIFSHLKHLNLSYNSISHLSVAVFEGISQLESLYLSHNKLSSIANIAVKLWKLKSLHLGYNHIAKVENLNSMIGLRELKLGHNEIQSINENSLISLNNLTILDLSGNQIPWIRSHFVNKTLQELRLTDNEFISIYSNAFESVIINNLFINDNKYMTLHNSFNRAKCDYLDLSNSNLQQIANNTFSGASLRSINLSTNALSKIEISSFSSVKDIQDLDLSNNALNTLAFLTPGVKNLKKLYFQKNMLEKISNNTFANVTSLELLDLSYNIIRFIEAGAFILVKKLNSLLLHNNRFFSIQVISFQGLSAFVKFDLSYTRIGSFTKAAVLGLKTTSFNCSHAELSHVHYDAFAEIEHIEILDLSHNSLVTFEVNPKGMASVESLYLNNNKITSISNISFVGFMELETLHLEFNNIVNIHTKAFSSLKSLRILNLSDNRDLLITSDVFSNLRGLVSLTMINNKKNYDFQHTENSTIEQVVLSSCDIEDLGSLYIFNINGVVSLNLSTNLISYIDKKSFNTMPKLILLDVSFNLIKSIEPGSFINTKNIVVLNVYKNQLSHFEHGVFQGLTALQTLNLSSNLIHDFNVNLLHSCVELKEISFENNLLTSLEFRKFVSLANMKKFCLGGNNISCHDIISFKKYMQDMHYNYNFVMSESPNYYTANVDGVTCRPDNNISNNDTNSTMNTTYLSKFTDTLEKIRKSIDNFHDDYYVKGIFNILFVILIILIIVLIVKYAPLQRFLLIARQPLNGHLSHNFSYNNMTQTISNDDNEVPNI